MQHEPQIDCSALIKISTYLQPLNELEGYVVQQLRKLLLEPSLGGACDCCICVYSYGGGGGGGGRGGSSYN